MGDLRKWLSEIRVFQSNQSSLHLFLGTFSHPRSTLVQWHVNSLEQPIRYPPISIETLDAMYDEISQTSLSNLQKYVLALLKLNQATPVTINGTNTENPEDDETQFKTMNYEVFANETFELTLDSVLPITKKIENWLSHDVPFDELELFCRIISHESAPVRQQFLTELVLIGSSDAWSLLYLLWHLRLEFKGAILRELGRQSVYQPLFELLCNQLLEKTDNPLFLSAFCYMRRFQFEVAKKLKIYSDLQYFTEKYLVWSPYQRIKHIRQLIKSNSSISAFAFLIVLANEPSKYITLVHDLIRDLDPISQEGFNFANHIQGFIKMAEFSDEPLLLATCLSLSLYGRSYDNSNSVVKLNPLAKTLQDSVRRLVSYLKLKNSLENEEMLLQITREFLKLYPHEEIVGEYNEYDEGKVKKWLDSHPYLSLLEQYLDKVFTTPTNYAESIYHLIVIPNKILESIVSKRLGSQEINVDIYPLDVQITLIKRYPANFAISPLHYQSVTISEISFSHQLIQEFILDFCILQQAYVSKELLRKLVKRAFDIDNSQFWLSFVEYVKYIQSTNMQKIDDIIDVVISTVTPDLINRRTDPSVQYFLFIVILQWQKIIGFTPNEALQQLIVALKMIFKEEINNFDLESSQHYDIETIVSVLELTNGEIPEFMEMCVQFAFTKPVWEQLARYFISIGLKRPKRSAISKSRLKEIPNYILRDVLGQIALINQIIAYCERNGFRNSFENLIVQNIYKRGWNVERRLERVIPSLFGNISPRLRSFLAAYLAIDQGEISTDILRLAGDVEEYQLRERIIRELERYGTPDMWIMLTQAYHPDISKRALEQLKETRMSPTQRSQSIRKLILSHKTDIRKVGIEWLHQYDLQQADYSYLLFNPYPDVWEEILIYIQTSNIHQQNYDKSLKDFILKILWSPNIKKSIRKEAIRAISLIKDVESKNELQEHMFELFQVSVSSKQNDAVDALSQLGGIS